jgi:hypothetical protein
MAFAVAITVPLLVMPPEKWETATTIPLPVAEILPALTMPPEKLVLSAASMPVWPVITPPAKLVMPPEKLETPSSRIPHSAPEMELVLLIPPANAETEAISIPAPNPPLWTIVPVLTIPFETLAFKLLTKIPTPEFGAVMCPEFVIVPPTVLLLTLMPVRLGALAPVAVMVPVFEMFPVMLALLSIAIQFAVVALVIEGAVPPVWVILQPAAYAGSPPLPTSTATIDDDANNRRIRGAIGRFA